MKTNIDLQINKVKQFSAKGWALGVCHGVSHWERVERNGLLLATELVNTTVVRLFAYLHDKWRVDNGEDLEHGKRAAIDHNIPLITNARLASAFINAFCNIDVKELPVKSWDEFK